MEKSRLNLSFLKAVFLLLFVVAVSSNITYSLKLETKTSGDFLIVEAVTQKATNCELKIGRKTLQFSSQNNQLHELKLNLTLFKDIDEAEVFCYNQQNLLDFERTTLKIPNPPRNKENVVNNTDANEKAEVVLEASAKSNEIDSELNQLILIIVLVSFATIFILFLIIFRVHSSNLKIKFEKNSPILTTNMDPVQKNEVNENKEHFDDIFNTYINTNMNNQKSSLNEELNINKNEVTNGLSTQSYSKKNLKEELEKLFSEFENNSKKDEEKTASQETNKNNNHKNKTKNKELFEQISHLLENNKAQDLTFMISEVIGHSLIYELIEFLNANERFVAKNKLIDVLNLLNKRKQIKDEEFNKLLFELTK